MIDFELEETQRTLVQTAREFGEQVMRPAELKLDKMASQDQIFESDLYWSVMKQAFELGFHKMSLMEMFGGLGLDASTIGMVWEELARWGVGDGVYLVLPLLGPSTLRDAAALPVDWEGDPVLVHTPVDERNALTVTRVVARRADLLGASRTLEEAALDRYVFLRESWLQRRRSQVYDGRPPRERPPAD